MTRFTSFYFIHISVKLVIFFSIASLLLKTCSFWSIQFHFLFLLFELFLSTYSWSLQLFFPCTNSYLIKYFFIFFYFRILSCLFVKLLLFLFQVISASRQKCYVVVCCCFFDISEESYSSSDILPFSLFPYPKFYSPLLRLTIFEQFYFELSIYMVTEWSLLRFSQPHLDLSNFRFL